MAVNKTLALNSAKRSLKDALSILEDIGEDVSFDSLRGAALQANQAAMELFQLAGVVDSASQP